MTDQESVEIIKKFVARYPTTWKGTTETVAVWAAELLEFFGGRDPLWVDNEVTKVCRKKHGPYPPDLTDLVDAIKEAASAADWAASAPRARLEPPGGALTPKEQVPARLDLIRAVLRGDITQEECDRKMEEMNDG